MKIICTIFICSILVTCRQKQEKIIKHPSLSTLYQTSQPLKDYRISKDEISLLKKRYKAGWSTMSLINKEKLFTDAVINNIVPQWIGTSWSFNGTTEIPRQGSIACGYFVTTVLRDAGLVLARIKLSQCPSEEMIRTLVQTKYISRFSNTTMNDFINSIHQKGYGLFIIGLDCHTGFIYNDGNEIYFINASYINEKKVISEKAATSWILQKSKYKIIGKISADEFALDKWIRN